MLQLNLMETMALAGVALGAGYAVRRVVPLLGRYNIPAPVLGGLLVAGVSLIARQRGLTLFTFDATLRNPLMIAFFTTIGFGASLRLLQQGGAQVMVFLALSTVAAVLQNIVGAVTAVMVGQSPLFGVLCGSVTLTGGPATGLAFAPQFEAAGVSGAETIAVAAAMSGILTGGIFGSPVGTLLIERLCRAPAATNPEPPPATAEEVAEAMLPPPDVKAPKGEDAESYLLLKSTKYILAAMWAGSLVSAAISEQGVTLPAYIGAMLVAAVLRNLDDWTGWCGLSQSTLDEVGSVALSFFLVLALMTLELWRLAAVAGPLAAIIVVQAALLVVFCRWPLFPSMGRDYDAAVMAGGFYGFMMGTTANAMANMDALVQRYGPAPRAFLVVPLVGAFFIDFANAILIQACLNWLG